MVVDRRTFIQSAAFLSTGGLLFYFADVLASGSPPLESWDHEQQLKPTQRVSSGSMDGTGAIIVQPNT
jgi:hypothetical protein